MKTSLGDGCLLEYEGGFIPNPAVLYTRMLETLPLNTHQVVILGEICVQPREVCWHGPEPYTYSGLTLDPAPWTEELTEVRELLKKRLNIDFNSVLVNHYVDGSNSVGWHADDEPAFGKDPTIATVSFGAPRLFCLKPKRGGEKHKTILDCGSLLVMSGGIQRLWLHSVPKTKIFVGPRLSLTYRVWKSSAGESA